MASTATTKTISQIGETRLELVKDTYDAFVFKLDASGDTPASQRTVMYISSDTDGTKPGVNDVSPVIGTSGLVTMSNTKVNGSITSGGDVIVGNQLHLTGSNESNVRGAIYAETGSDDNHKIIIDPYQQDDNDPTTNNGTVYIRGNLIVQGDKTILDTAEHVTAENLFGINAAAFDTNGDVIGGTTQPTGIHVYYKNSENTTFDTQFVYDFTANENEGRWLTGASTNSLKDFQSKNIYAVKVTSTDLATLSSVDIGGGNIDDTAIGENARSSGKFTTIDADSINGITTTKLVASGAIQFKDTRPTTATIHSIFDVGTITTTGGADVDTRTLGDNTIHVNARGVNAITVGNIVPVELTSGSVRLDVQTLSSSVTAAPLHADILHYFTGKTFAAGKCVAALTNGTDASVAMFSFSICGSTLTMVLDQEVHSDTAVLSLDYDSSGIIKLNLGTAANANYCVKVLPIMTSDSITEKY